MLLLMTIAATIYPQFKITAPVPKSFSFKELCVFSGINSHLLIKQADPEHVDCMGRKINIHQFCAKQLNFSIKGEIVNNRVLCWQGDDLYLRIANNCTNWDEQCLQEHCLAIQKKRYINLQLKYASKIDDDVQCIFSM